MTSITQSTQGFPRRAVLAGAVAAIAAAAALSACADPNPVDLKVVDRETGQELRTWRHHGRLFVAGEPGARYSLRVCNHTDGRVLVVMSVDGVNIVTGETAKYSQNGYVLSGHESYDISGWRKSNSEIAAFAFAPLPQSYAARTGRPDDVGVIGLAVFKERARPAVPDYEPPSIGSRWREESRRGASGAAAAGGGSRLQGPGLAAASPPAAALKSSPSAQASAAYDMPRDERLGTAHGAREWSVADTTTFERATPFPISIRRIEYDTFANLVASGVIPPSPYADRRPRPFPMDPEGAGFVPDPPGDR